MSLPYRLIAAVLLAALLASCAKEATAPVAAPRPVKVEVARDRPPAAAIAGESAEN